MNTTGGLFLDDDLSTNEELIAEIENTITFNSEDLNFDNAYLMKSIFDEYQKYGVRGIESYFFYMGNHAVLPFVFRLHDIIHKKKIAKDTHERLHSCYVKVLECEVEIKEMKNLYKKSDIEINEKYRYIEELLKVLHNRCQKIKEVLKN